MLTETSLHLDDGDRLDIEVQRATGRPGCVRLHLIVTPEHGDPDYDSVEPLNVWATRAQLEQLADLLRDRLAALSVDVECPTCGGEGVIGGLVVGDDVVDQRCPGCSGRGRVQVPPADTSLPCWTATTVVKPMDTPPGHGVQREVRRIHAATETDARRRLGLELHADGLMLAPDSPVVIERGGTPAVAERREAVSV